ncbi:hypothetical protein PHYPSEUDO_011415, partial [Phytophthora pseudosyringae]
YLIRLGACPEDLDRFSHSMGWTSRDVDDGADLDNATETPTDFVPPTVCASKARTRHKATSTPSRTYRKRATGPPASSSAETHPGDGRPPSEQQQHKRPSSRKQPKPTADPIDFVYDINVRRRLREQVDAERSRILQEATAREAKLRAQSRWVFDKRQASPPPRRKQAWQASTRSNSSPSSKAADPEKDSRAALAADTDDVELSIREFERRLPRC